MDDIDDVVYTRITADLGETASLFWDMVVGIDEEDTAPEDGNVVDDIIDYVTEEVSKISIFIMASSQYGASYTAVMELMQVLCGMDTFEEDNTGRVKMTPETKGCGEGY